jgi:hypothetical protein
MEIYNFFFLLEDFAASLFWVEEWAEYDEVYAGVCTQSRSQEQTNGSKEMGEGIKPRSHSSVHSEINHENLGGKHETYIKLTIAFVFDFSFTMDTFMLTVTLPDFFLIGLEWNQAHYY